MKKILFLVAAVFTLCASYVFATNSESQTTTSQVCQFSLNHYTGTIKEGHHEGYTSGIVVRLNCPQENDVCATVFVYIDGEVVASDIFEISAGSKDSFSKTIEVPSEYAGKRYTLKVM